ncbi:MULTISPECIES: FAD-binding oxidoreductase [Pseudomonas]|uniref:O-acetylhomoserine sulfhydrylase n=1 Tax=Pseudomonas chlororaphis subsp. aureofaciens TaxID=587851 RepID=A0AAD1E5U7_9PSED|nr:MULTISPECIES: FAD-binding oxidoreductase [Pseudomonas]AIC19447.1 FAD-dependent oxidoreductase [Pseudomonas chlororaphis]AZE22863.1 O-acetylhomoserine sulfhydrylase [Pseudomonas chlororaphis subsp. aureofaciens]AZE29151.1 O-acetylhomoserine sulfhydrylase [Pseudomonas chlororaphis subsp. aureofaciens]AZE35453.1 O-acetylhomoserine sulfhydrylase [Pseudomonas chlororaphis subsp. aureofaciens]AZE41808.1 O-acetylhomoserine sulfhydrylase [Pseudomonas chlororaphis subsp. aureofaciens]
MTAAFNPVTPAAERCPSYYSATLNDETAYPPLQGQVSVDVVIIGGGFTGVASAVELAEKGLKVALVESHKIGWGATGRNGGQVTGSLSGDEAMRKQMRRTLGDEVDDFIWQLRWRGHRIIRQRVDKYAIACDLKHGHLHAAYKPSHLAGLRADYEEAVRRGMGDEVSLLDQQQLREVLDSPLYHGAIKNTRNLHLHPLNLCIGEARAAESLGALIFEHSEVLQIVHGERPAVITAQGRIDARQVLLAGDVYHKLEPKQLKGKIFPAMGGIVTTAPLGDLAKRLNPQDLAVYDCRFVLDYYRMTADGRLLFGGGANYSGKDSRDIAGELRPCIERTFPALKGVAIDFQWSCAMGIVINRIPQLGKLSDNVWYCQGYSGHGIATSHIMGEIMAQAITGHLGDYDTFAACQHIRVPFGDQLGNPMLAAGMWYYQMLERLR